MLYHEVMFCIFATESNKETFKQPQIFRWNYYKARPKVHPANWTHMVTLRMMGKT